MSEDRLPIQDVLPVVAIHPLSPDPTAVQIQDVFVMVKYLDADGDSAWAYRTSRAPNREELLGALTVHVRLLEHELVADWVEE